MSEAGLAWWIWAIAGLLLAALELATPGGFYLLFFGIGALAVALLAWSGIATSLLPQLLLFSALSIAATVLFRRRLVDRMVSRVPEARDSMLGEVATALDDIDAGGFGKVELRGTPWNARNRGEAGLGRGGRCVVEKVEGLQLWVRAV